MYFLVFDSSSPVIERKIQQNTICIPIKCSFMERFFSAGWMSPARLVGDSDGRSVP